MKDNQKLGSLLTFVACLAVCGAASVANSQIVNAENPRHDWMDAKAAKRDIAKLRIDRSRAVAYKNWAKVAQDDRLIRSDQLWILKYRHRLHNSG